MMEGCGISLARAGSIRDADGTEAGRIVGGGDGRNGVADDWRGAAAG